MRRFLVFLAMLGLVFMVSCGDGNGSGDSGKKQGELYGSCYPNKTCNEGLTCDEENDVCLPDGNDSDTDNDIDISDTEISDNDSDNSQEPDEDAKDPDDSDDPTDPTDTDDEDQEPTTPDNDTPETPDETPVNPEATENHKISGAVQAGNATAVAMYECSGTEKIAEANTDAKGKFSFNADITASKTYCVKAGDIASCFKGMSDHTANISEITNAVYLLDKTCADLRKSETKIRTYAKLGTGEWLGELDYSKLSGISEGLKLLANYLGTTDSKTLSAKIAEDAKKEAPEFAKLFNGFRASANKTEIVIGESADNSTTFSVEGGSAKVAPNFKISWTLKNKSAEAATYKFTTSTPGEYVARAKLVSGNSTVSESSANVLYLQKKKSGAIYLNGKSKNISHYIDNGIYVVIPKDTVVKKDGKDVTKITYDILSSGGNQVSRLKFYPEGAVFEGDSMYFVYELGTVYGGDPKTLSATRMNADGTVDVLNSAAGDPIMMAAAGDPIMTTAAGDPIMQAAAGDPIMTNAAGDPIMTAAAGDPIMTSAAGDPIMTSAAGDPIMSAAAGDPIMTSAAGDPIMANAAGDPIMMGTSSSTMISQTSHYSIFTVETANLPVSVDALLDRWCDGSFYRNYSPVAFIEAGFQKYKPTSTILPYLTCESRKFGDLGNDLYELINKQVGYQRNLNLIENIFFVSEFYNRMKVRRESGEVAAVKNGLELRSAIAALYTATTSYNRSATLADLFDSSMIPLTYSGATPADYTAKAKSAITGNSGSGDTYTATKKEMMIFANYITTSSKGPDFDSVESVLTPDQLVCAWFDSNTEPQNCNKIYTLNDAGHVALGGTELSAAEANAIFSKHFMPMNSRLSDEEKLDLFRTFYLALKYAGTIFYGGSDIDELNDALLKTAYLVFDGIDDNAKAVSIVDTFDASAHTVSVLDGNDMATRPYLTKLSALTDQISLKVAASSADVEKVLISIEGNEFEKVQENTRTYYKPKGSLKEKSIVLTPGTLSGLKPLKDLLGSENVDELGNITGKLTIVANSKISGKTYSTQKAYEFFVNGESDGVNSKEVPANIQIFVNDSTGHAIPANANPTIILNPGNKVYYSETGMVSLENLTPAAYTIDAFADGYYAKNVSVNVPAGATFSVEIRLDEELTSSADANLELNISINTVKHPAKVYVQIYNDNMDLVANETARFVDETNKYETLNIEINSGRYTLLAVGEDMYKYLEAITLYEGNNSKEITVIAKNACGNGIVDSAEECEPSVEGSTLEVLCGEIYPASTYPEKTATCDPATCTFNKSECGKAALCGDGIIDKPTEACDGGSKACAEIAGIGASTGSAPCADDCSGYITADNCSQTTGSCGDLKEHAVWNDGNGTFTQTHNGEEWIPATKAATFGLTKEECVFSCKKGYKWNGSICEQYPLSLGRICTGETDCFDNTEETECPAYGAVFFGQDAQYATAKYCTPHDLTETGNGIVKDAYTHYEWQASSSTAMKWSAANDYCSHLNDESTSSAMWRIPSPAELLTIIDSGSSSPALGDIFTARSHTFWAAEDAKQNGNAWRVDENGALTSVAKTTLNSVLCVRTNDYDAAENRFTATDETVKDNESGLMWQKQAVASRTWAEALNYCEEVSTADKFDWRLPNRNELASLINYEKADGAISDFPGIAAKGFWSSTSSLTGNEAWTVDFASGAIEATGKTNTKYIICVRNDEPCFGDECADPCSFDACKGMANSTGLCTANDYSFTCGCKSGFNWNHGKCLLATTRYIACEGLPENAIWNSVFGISQSYDGENWYPSETGTFNKIASTTECRFICATNYKWDADEEKCLPVSKITNCTDKKPYSEWNVVSKISQTWNGDAWEPSEISSYNEEPSEDECRFICKENYEWDSVNKLCQPEKRHSACTGLPANAVWHYETIEQTWTGTSWTPTTNGTHSTGAIENECHFKCAGCYTWDNGACVAKTRSELCKGLPENAVWNEVATIYQECNGEDFGPSDIGVYDEEPSKTECRFKCRENFTWDGKGTCVANTRFIECNPRPANSLWNEVHFITQTWNGSEWLPSLDPKYSVSPSNSECKYKCDTGYYPLDGRCVADPCNDNGYNPCSEVNNSTGACTANNNVFLPYSCECTDGYSWHGKTGCRSKKATLGNICTDEIKCFNNEEEIACPSQGNDFYGQDAQYAEMGYCTPKMLEVKETIVGAETQKTVIDKNTGLEWLKSRSDESYNQEDAVTYCDGLVYGGHTDWRLPSARELMTVLSYTQILPELDREYFENIYVAWTSTPDLNESNNAVLMAFGQFHPEIKTNEFGAVCVRGNALPESEFSAFTVNGDEIVKDLTTELYWQKTYVTEKTWPELLEYCENLEYGGFSDWRMPNISELRSLINYEKSYPASDFPNMPSDWLISSTTHFSADTVEGVLFETGLESGFYKSGSSGSVRCVRSDLCDEGEFLFGKNCVASPCKANSCEIEHSDGICTPINLDDFSCGCDEGYSWNGSKCINNPCFDNQCSAIEHSDGICTPLNDTEFACGCADGYFWKGSRCMTKHAFGNICTGQTKCFDETGEIACPVAEGEDFFGQDAQYAAKERCTPQSFTDDAPDSSHPEEIIVIDNNTGLMWQKNIPGLKPDWYHAVAYCSDLEYAGYSDWRLPKPEEFLSIADLKNTDPSIFTYPGPGYFSPWTSASVIQSIGDAFIMDFSSMTTNMAYTSKEASGAFDVVCVRGNILPKSRFVVSRENGYEIVTDTVSGLIWQKTSLGWQTWKDALAYCENSEYAGFTDWRVPNLKEAFTLADFTKTSGIATNFPDMSNITLWTSNTIEDNVQSAYILDFAYGIGGGYMEKTDYQSVLCVR